jgi:hypothetical protein
MAAPNAGAGQFETTVSLERWRAACLCAFMSAHLNPIPAPIDLDLVASKYRIATLWVEEIVLLLRNNVSDAEILADVQNPAGADGGSPQAIPLADERCRALLADLKKLLTRSSN